MVIVLNATLNNI